jgi:immune inhibitor A
VDFSHFDADADGFVDGLIVVHAGPAAEEETDTAQRRRLIWSHKSTLPSAVTLDGVQLYAFTLQAEEGRVGVFCHEFGHFLGLPDLYDTTGRSEGAGDWCLMGTGSWGGGGDAPVDMSAWCRARLGWVPPRAVGGNEVPVGLLPAHRDRGIVRLGLRGASPSEYYLLESRQRDGLDAALPGEGLLIWHIDEAAWWENRRPTHYMVGLVEADNARELERGFNRGDAGDPYPGTSRSTRFGPETSPSSSSFGRESSGVTVERIGYDSSSGRVAAVVSAPADGISVRRGLKRFSR